MSATRSGLAAPENATGPAPHVPWQAGRGGVKKTNDKHICTLLQLERVLVSFLFHTPPFLPRLTASFSAAAAVESQQAVMTEAHR